jgi:hypothetical protein
MLIPPHYTKLIIRIFFCKSDKIKQIVKLKFLFHITQNKELTFGQNCSGPYIMCDEPHTCLLHMMNLICQPLLLHVKIFMCIYYA